MKDLLLVIFLIGVGGAMLAIAGSFCNLVLGLLGLSCWELFVASVGISIGAFFIALMIAFGRSGQRDGR